MANKGETLKVFDEYVSKMMHDKLVDMQKQINSLEGDSTLDEVTELLVDANSWVSLLCGDNENAYEDWRYRLFMTSIGQAIVIQGQEVDVDFRSWMDNTKK